METISLLNMVVMGFTVVVILGALLGGVLYMRSHAEGWFIGVIGGLLGYMIFGYMIYVLILFGIGQIGSVSEYFNNHAFQYEGLAQAIHFICEILALIIGVKLLCVYNKRRNVETTLAMAIAFGMGIYAFTIIVGQMLSYCTQYITYAKSINDMGVEGMVQTLLEEYAGQEGVTEETVRQFIQSIIDDNPWDYLISAIVNILKAVVQIGCAIISFGVFKKKINKKYLWTLCGICALYYIPNLLSIKINIPVWGSLIICLLIAAFTVYVAIKIIKSNMPEELQSLSKEHKVERVREENKPPKMPKIKMPD